MKNDARLEDDHLQASVWCTLHYISQRHCLKRLNRRIKCLWLYSKCFIIKQFVDILPKGHKMYELRLTDVVQFY